MEVTKKFEIQEVGSITEHPDVEKALERLNGAKSLLTQYEHDYAAATDEYTKLKQEAQKIAVLAGTGEKTASDAATARQEAREAKEREKDAAEAVAMQVDIVDAAEIEWRALLESTKTEYRDIAIINMNIAAGRFTKNIDKFVEDFTELLKFERLVNGYGGHVIHLNDMKHIINLLEQQKRVLNQYNPNKH